MAAGMGTRYGGLKQIETVDSNGHTLIDYAIYDAVRAGFGKIVFVIRESFEDAFKAKIGKKLDGIIETAYVYQKLDACLGSYALPANREKPWGTGHAILVAKEAINEPFCAINADDYYGYDAFKSMCDYLSDPSKIKPASYVMVGYILKNTLSPHGGVARGICEIDAEGFLVEVVERTKIHTSANNTGYAYTDDAGNEHPVKGDDIVSINFWGFHPSVFEHLQDYFGKFMANHGSEEKSEMFIPSVVDELIDEGKIKMKVLTTDERWMGVTYAPDLAIAQEFIAEMIDKGHYPNQLSSRKL